MNCMQEARILTVMFQQGNDVVSFKEANFFPFFFFFFLSFSMKQKPPFVSSLYILRSSVF